MCVCAVQFPCWCVNDTVGLFRCRVSAPALHTADKLSFGSLPESNWTGVKNPDTADVSNSKSEQSEATEKPSAPCNNDFKEEQGAEKHQKPLKLTWFDHLVELWRTFALSWGLILTADIVCADLLCFDLPAGCTVAPWLVLSSHSEKALIQIPVQLKGVARQKTSLLQLKSYILFVQTQEPLLFIRPAQTLVSQRMQSQLMQALILASCFLNKQTSKQNF